MIPILDNSDRARHAVLFFWVYSVVILAFIGTKCVLLWEVNELQTRGNVSDTLTNVYNWISPLVSLSTFAIFIAVIIVFIQWFRRAYHNLQRGGNYIENSEGAAAWYWFIPILNFSRPYKIMKEIWYETQGTYTSDLKSHGILRVWWILFLLSNFRFEINVSGKSESLMRNTIIDISRGIITIPAILIAIYVVKQVASFEEQYMQQQKIESLGTIVPVTEDNQEEEFY
ncbi:DUF4328 domain-containing protein [Xanthocytophaga agilis]|uniref:DUF4328 domain-containing protein n=1 Tax=Xanthocytophaga agilis TaxID=3048010 RepID=A0AAE3R6V2_9BACT|nr:DUF4328 domain-containing protein [Xanthocytophaga agilis]MDJ1504824.1 DUF4328 domain-containing protein [Xanthocytophaga agilis]